MSLVRDPTLESNEVYLKTVVIDKGPGMDFEVMKTLNQSEDTLTLKDELNLDINTAKLLASAQNGSVSIESERGIGTNAIFQIKVIQGYNDKSQKFYTPLMRSFALQHLSVSKEGNKPIGPNKGT